MKNPFAKLTQKMVETTSEQVRKEVKKTVLDVLPGLITIAGTIIGIVIFHNMHGESDSYDYDSGHMIPAHSSTTITTNNYFFQDISDDMMWKILEDDGRD